MNRLLLTFLLLTSFLSFRSNSPTGIIPELRTIKTGLLVGAQKGQYFGIELGMERQWKELKLKKPFTWAIAANGEYHLGSNNLGFKAGPWFKWGRADFTYGVNLTYLSDFEYARVGFSPAIGFKLIGFHLIASYNSLYGPDQFDDYNKLHISLRYYISKDRKFKWAKKDKGD
jgi:hypothetical protein